ncbi:MAG TPA: calcium-binding protein [Allosphingosinicella sp.]
MATYTGTDEQDYLYGNSEPDTIYGRGGNDQIYGRGGSDWLYGEDGDDFISLNYAIAPSDVVRAFGGADEDRFYISLNGQGGGRLEADGGDGNDIVWLLSLQSVSAVLTLGQGSDSIRISGGYQAVGGATVTVADFATGDSGDRIEWDYYLYHKLAGWDRTANPFEAGYLRLVQSGADTLLEVDQDGAGGLGSFVTLLTYQNVTAGDLTAQNLGGYASAGGGIVGLTLAGREIRDEIRGSSAGDLIEGLGGNDQVLGVLGDDVLVGGAGDDDLRGDEGDDILRGGADNDTLIGGAGNDRMFGGDGNDLIQSFDGGTDEVYGEDGNDRIAFSHSSSTVSTGSFISGGAGDDEISITFYADGGTAAFDAGEGADLVTIAYIDDTSISVTLGAGVDRLKLQPGVSSADSIVIEDFDPGAGETIDWLAYLASNFRTWDGAFNPFGGGLARLVQSGTDTVFQVSESGFSPWSGAYDSIITFKSVDASLFTATTMGGFAPDGSVAAALNLTGTAADERFDGGVGADTLDGAGGKDTMFGSAGHDTLRGGEGDDTLNGELGNDLLEGGDGADVLDGGTGQDRVYGGEGNDRLAVGQSGATDHLYGEGGDDILYLNFWGSMPNGPHIVERVASGGTGDDTIYVSAGTYSTIAIDGGEGADTVVLQEVWASNATLTLGTGRDTVRFDRYYRHTSYDIAVTDFVAGTDGDMVDWDGHLGDYLKSWDKVTNPFALGYVRLLQNGADTVVQLDWDAGGTVAPKTMLILKNVTASTLVAANFDGFDPQVPLIVNGTGGPDTLNGTTGRDSISGGDGNDTITASAGDDRLDGGTGADAMNGGGGNDVFIVDDAGDQVVEAAGDGTDEVHAALASYTLTANVENLRATTDIAHDFRGNGGNNIIVGAAGNDVIRGQDGGDDLLFGVGGVDSFYMGGAFGTGDFIDGGDNRDSLILQGNYPSLTLTWDITGGSSIANIEGISLISGTSTQYGQSGTSLYSYDLTLVDGNVAAGALMKVNGFNLQAGENFTLDASAETDAPLQVFAGFGKDSFTGGQQGDAFIFGHDGRFAAGDSVNGGDGYDVVYLRGDYTIDFNAAGFENALTNVESIAILTSANNEFAGGGDGDFDYAVTWADALLAAGATFTVNASRLQAHETFAFDGATETNGVLRIFGGAAADVLTGGGGADQLHGGGGADVLTGGGGADLFRYSLMSDSTANAKDVVNGFVAGIDKIDLNRVDARGATTDSNEAFAFIGANAFSAAGPGGPGELRAFNVADDVWQVEGDVNGDGVADIVIEVHVEAGQPLTAADFIV